MDRQDEIGFDPEQIFNEGTIAGQADLQAQLRDRLQAELNLSQDEVEALFDPAPRRHRRGHKRGKINCSAKQRATMPQICKGASSGRKTRRHARRSAVRTYDPAPSKTMQTVRRAGSRVKRRASGVVNKVLPYVPLIVGAGTFYSLYSTRATDLKAAGKLNKDGTPVDGVIDAIMYDINNYSVPITSGGGGGTAGSIERVKGELPSIIGSLIGGFAISAATKGTKYSKYGDVANKSLMAYAAAVTGKAILDPPINGAPVRSSQQVGQVVQAQVGNSYAPPQDTSRMRSQAVIQSTQSSGFVNPY